MSSFYLAGRFSRKEELRGYRVELEELGHEVTSRWLMGGHELTDAELADESLVAIEKRGEFAEDDYSDIVNSDEMICYTEDPHSPAHGASRGGRHVEFGMALAWGMPVHVVGPRENVFYCLPAAWSDGCQITVYDSWADFLEALR